MTIRQALVVDDSKSARMMLQRLLSKINVNAEAVESAEEALRFLEKQQPDVIFMDHMMPGMDGLELAARIRNLPDTNDVQILVVTGRDESDSLEQALHAGANDYLEKPVSPQQLMVRLEIAKRNLELRESKKESERKGALMLRVFDNSMHGILITDRNNKIIYTNRAFSRITGFESDEALGQTPAFLSSGFHSEAFYKQLWESISNHGGWKGEIWNKRKNGEIYPEWLEISTVVNEDRELTHFIAHFSGGSPPFPPVGAAFYRSWMGRFALQDAWDAEMGELSRQSRRPERPAPAKTSTTSYRVTR